MNAACIDEPHWRSTDVAADGLGPARHERGHAPDVERLLADLADAAHLDVLDLARLDVETRDEAVEHLRRELVRAHPGEHAVPPPDRRAHGVDDECLGHARDGTTAGSA